MIDAITNRRLARSALTAAGVAVVVVLGLALACGPLAAQRHSFAEWITSAALAEYGGRTLAVDDLLRIKKQWLLGRQRAELAVFGNSRTIFLGADDLNIDQAAFVNASVVGSGFRQSVRLLQALAESGRAPETALINLDPWPMGFWGEIAADPRPYVRIDLSLRDAARIAERGGAWRRSLQDDVVGASRLFADELKADMVARRLRYLSAGILFPLPTAGERRLHHPAADGHVPQPANPRLCGSCRHLEAAIRS